MKKLLSLWLILGVVVTPLFYPRIAVEAVEAVDEVTEEAAAPVAAPAPTPTPDVVVGAPPEYLYPGLLPDHPLYFLKDLYYRLRTRLVFGAVNQVEWYLKLTDKRAAEARELARKGKLELAAQASQKTAQMYARAVEKAQKLGSEPPIGLSDKFKKVGLRQKVVLEGVLERVQPEAKQVVVEAMENSKKSLERALAQIGEKLSELPPAEEREPKPADKIDPLLLDQAAADPDQSFEVQVRLAESITEDDKLELEKLMDVQVYTERQAVGEAAGEDLERIAGLPFVSRITLLPKATEEE